MNKTQPSASKSQGASSSIRPMATVHLTLVSKVSVSRLISPASSNPERLGDDRETLPQNHQSHPFSHFSFKLSHQF